MSLPCRASLVAVAVFALAGCDRETRDIHGLAMKRDDRAEAFAGNAWHIGQGQKLYTWMNCSGCHSQGGGGMGPPLMDANWRYGGSMSEIVRTILDGRPNGMPAFRNRITQDQAWQLAAYVRSLSARTRQDALGGRPEAPAGVEPPTLQSRQPVLRVDPEKDKAVRE